MRLRLAAAALWLSASIAASACAQPLQYQSADGMNNTPVSAANPLPVAATFGGSVTTACTASSSAPTYSAGANPLSCDLAGGMRISGITGALSAQANASAPTATEGQSVPLSLDLNRNLRITGSVGLSGTLPAFASTPTVNIGTLPNVTLTGTLPAFAATPSVNSQALANASPAGASEGVNTALSMDLSRNLRVFDTQVHTDLQSLETIASSSIPSGSNTIGSVNQAGTWTVGLSGTLPAFASTPTVILGAGTAIAGKFDVDQTTPGTTNGVVTNAGSVTSATLTGQAPGAANNPTTQVSVGTTATLIVAARTARAIEIVSIPPSSTLYVGGSGVTTSTGFQIVNGSTSSGSYQVPSAAALYGVVATGTLTVSQQEIY